MKQLPVLALTETFDIPKTSNMPVTSNILIDTFRLRKDNFYISIDNLIMTESVFGITIAVFDITESVFGITIAVFDKEINTFCMKIGKLYAKFLRMDLKYLMELLRFYQITSSN